MRGSTDCCCFAWTGLVGDVSPYVAMCSLALRAYAATPSAGHAPHPPSSSKSFVVVSLHSGFLL